MAIFVFTYDLRNESGSHDYQPLWDELERLGAHRFQDSAWFVNLNNTAKEVVEHFKGFTDSDDRLFASVLTKQHWFSNARGGTNAWLKANPPG
ncbi:MAG: hypothetical protein MRY81_10070 [Donghicola eburneus]|jgi:hypothetical protein|nr:hypothetical protein [Donghicola eburneus]MCI5040018.1 hypothetical protein [Donghicola eburneus]